jgi:hypothetical protein
VTGVAGACVFRFALSQQCNDVWGGCGCRYALNQFDEAKYDAGDEKPFRPYTLNAVEAICGDPVDMDNGFAGALENNPKFGEWRELCRVRPPPGTWMQTALLFNIFHSTIILVILSLLFLGYSAVHQWGRVVCLKAHAAPTQSRDGVLCAVTPYAALLLLIFLPANPKCSKA